MFLLCNIETRVRGRKIESCEIIKLTNGKVSYGRGRALLLARGLVGRCINVKSSIVSCYPLLDGGVEGINCF